MSHAQERVAIMSYQTPPIDVDTRAQRLVEAIKAETRWLLLTAPQRSFAIDASHYTNDRAAFVLAWPRFRNQSVPRDELRGFWDLVADQASILTGLIELRQQKQKPICAENGRNDQDERRV
jgi:hypothetical protein